MTYAYDASDDGGYALIRGVTPDAWEWAWRLFVEGARSRGKILYLSNEGAKVLAPEEN